MTLRLTGTARLSALLNHLYVLIPVLDDDKHYWVGEDEMDKLLKRGEGWLDTPSGEGADRAPLPQPPPRSLADRRWSGWRRRRESEDADAESAAARRRTRWRRRIRLNDERMGAVVEALRASGAQVHRRPRLRRRQAAAAAGPRALGGAADRRRRRRARAGAGARSG